MDILATEPVAAELPKWFFLRTGKTMHNSGTKNALGGT